MTKKTTSLFFISLASLLLLTGCDDTQRDLVDEQDRHVRSGIEQVRLKNWDKAIATFRKALEENPSLARPHLELALIYHQEKKNYIYAVYHYEQYLGKRPDSEKRALIDDWIRQAKISLGAQIGRTSGNISEELVRLTRENNLLQQQLNAYQGKPTPTPEVVQLDAPPVKPVETPKRIVVELDRPLETPEKQAASTVRQPATHTVRPGDTLSSIARTVYNDSSKWRDIYNANRDQMKKENDLKAGQVLKIPSLKK